MKVAGLLLLWGGAVAFVYASSVDPRGILRRQGSDYVADLDRSFTAMLLPKRGNELAWLQLVLVVACIACHALTSVSDYLVLAAFAAVLPRSAVQWLLKRRRAKIDGQAHGFALALANTLRTTANVSDALRFTVEVIEKPIREEIDIALREIHVGSTAEEALLAVAGRADAPMLDIVVSTVLIGQKTGGDLPRILETSAASLRELKRLEEYTDKVTRDPKRGLALSVGIVVLTIGMLPKYIPGVLDPLFTTSKGQLAVLYAVLIFIGSLIFTWRVTRKSI